MPLIVYYPRKLTHENEEVIRSSLEKGIELQFGETLPQPAEYHILVNGRPTLEQLESSPNLRSVIIPFAGVPEITLERLKEFPQISLHNLHHNAETTAETALMLLFSAAKQLGSIEDAFRQNDWRPRYQPNPARLLHGKTMLLLGFGAIGQHIARVAQAMGMRILAIRRNPDKGSPDELDVELFAPSELHAILPRSEILVSSLPLTEETQGMIGEKEINRLPDQAIIVNVGRGGVIDQKALFEGLQNGKLHSAGIDVWYNYPADEEARSNTAPADYPFHELENIVMSPHRGGGAVETEYLRLKDLAKLINADHKGGVIPNQVNIQEGY